MAAVKVKSVDLHARYNNPNHHTDKFHLSRKDQPQLIVRRCQRVVFKINLDAPNPVNELDSNAFSIVATHSAAATPSERENSMVKMNINPEPFPIPSLATWQAYGFKVQNPSGGVSKSSLLVKLIVGANAAIGVWNLSIYIKTPTGAYSVYKVPETMYILFNPWSSDETVFLKDDDTLDEYVLADAGELYTGNYSQIVPVPWSFGQFEKTVLDCALFMLAEGPGGLSSKELGDPVIVARRLTNIVSSVIEGSWKPTFDDEPGNKPPWYWNGSAAIIKQYFKSKETVKYAQCWVLGGVCATMCRALGLPCRVVTNYESAHDEEKNLMCEVVIDEDGNPELIEGNSIWNFHVWNEVWMKRPDIKKKGDFDGWQAIDATPQVKSDGEYRLGPMSVKALRRGDIDVPYDGFYSFAEVNADYVLCRSMGAGKPDKLTRLIKDIGVMISTKGVKNNNRVDITDEYKPPEHTALEREVYFSALGKIDNLAAKKFAVQNKLCDISVVFKGSNSGSLVGETMRVVYEITNKNLSKSFTLKGKLSVLSENYTTKNRKVLKFGMMNTRIKPGEVHVIKSEMSYYEYGAAFTAYDTFKAVIFTKVVELDYDLYYEDYMNLSCPQMQIDCGETQHVHAPFRVVFSFKNTLPTTVTKGVFSLVCPGITKPMEGYSRDTPQGQNVWGEATLTARATGRKTLTVSFTSYQFPRISRQKEIFIK